MAHEKMLATMLADLRRRRARKEVIDDYLAHWNDAQMNPGKPLPCPTCFYAGKKDSRLKALSARGDIQRVNCVVCGDLFGYPADG